MDRGGAHARYGAAEAQVSLKQLQVRALIEFPRDVFWPGHACFARADGLGHPCFEYKVVNPYVTAYGLACEI